MILLFFYVYTYGSMVTGIQVGIQMEGGKENVNLVLGEQEWKGGEQ